MLDCNANGASSVSDRYISKPLQVLVDMFWPKVYKILCNASSQFEWPHLRIGEQVAQTLIKPFDSMALNFIHLSICLV